MNDLCSIDPVQILPESWYGEYRSHRDIIYRELVRLNASVFVLERVHAFPFHIFAPYGARSHFWELSALSLFETSVLAIWKLGIDSEPACLTLGQFKNRVMRHIQDEAIQGRFRLETRGFNRRFRPFRKKIDDLRHNLLAHWNSNWINAGAEFRKERAVGVGHLKAASQLLWDLFSMACFKDKSEYAALPIDYFLEEKNPWRSTDIDELLDAIARNSFALTQPEEDAEGWRMRRARLSTSDLEAFNRHRVRCDLVLA